MHSEPQIHGSIFMLLLKFVENTYGAGTWLKLLESAGLSKINYEPHQNYPAIDLARIITNASNYTGLSENDLTEKFGESLVPDLLRIYSKYINPEWKTFEMIENTELVMHKAVRKEESKASPPVLNVSRVHDKLLVIDYYSERKMASLAIGIIKGIAKHYNESEKVQVIPLTNPNAERVQIRIEFL